jgi:uncharacterized protein YqgC (DUF456 family)
MTVDLAGPLRLARHPLPGFQAEAAEGPAAGPAFLRMLAWRTLLGWVDGALALWGFSAGYSAFRALKGPLWSRALEALSAADAGIDPADLREMLAQLPELPSLPTLLLWMVPLVPLGVASAWLHNVVWDHGCLWLLGGVDRNRGWRVTMRAESAAMWAGSVGIALGLLGHLPVAGLLLAPVLGAVGAYFWVLRGVALATFHGCPVWKGALATLLHIVLAVCAGCGTILLSWQLALRLAGGLDG